jgi:hypothetical protein
MRVIAPVEALGFTSTGGPKKIPTADFQPDEKVLKNIKLSRWLRSTGVFERAPVARKARATE